MIDHSDLTHLNTVELLNEQAYTDLHIDELQGKIKQLARETQDRKHLALLLGDHVLAVDRLMAIRHEWERRQSVSMCENY